MAPDEIATEDIVRLWTLGVDVVDTERLLPLLSAAERERAGAQPEGAVRQRFVAARATLRAALGELTGAEPASLALTEGVQGKPELVGDGGWRFNVSHSGRLALVAVARGRDVGVDVERLHARARLDAVARRCFSAAEREALRRSPEDERLELFYAVWTAREAFVKATGRGLAAAADTFEVPPWPAGSELPVPVAERGVPEPRYSVLRLAPAPGYAGALVAGGVGWRVDHRPPPAAVAAA